MLHAKDVGPNKWKLVSNVSVIRNLIKNIYRIINNKIEFI